MIPKKTETAIVQYSMLLMMMDGQKIAAKKKQKCTK